MLELRESLTERVRARSAWLCVYRLCTASGNEQLTQNWYGPGESDCLIKTKHCDGDNFVLTQCDFCPVL